jgi:hypothetical protein
VHGWGARAWVAFLFLYPIQLYSSLLLFSTKHRDTKHRASVCVRRARRVCPTTRYFMTDSAARCASSRRSSLAQSNVTAKYVVHIVVDDLGYDDVGYHNSRFITPTLDRLRSCGIHLSQFYAFKTCAPSRASMLAGRYPFNMGIYENADIDSFGIPTNFTLLPELFHRAGFATHAIGKWHRTRRP